MEPTPSEPAVLEPATLRVLIVDDEVDHADIIAALLRRHGYHAAVALSGADAIELAHLLEPDLILLDLYMPTVDGFSTAAALRGDPDTREMPIVFLSASGDEEAGTRVLEAGVLEYLPKPFHASELLACVERSIRRATLH